MFKPRVVLNHLESFQSPKISGSIATVAVPNFRVPARSPCCHRSRSPRWVDSNLDSSPMPVDYHYYGGQINHLTFRAVKHLCISRAGGSVGLVKHETFALKLRMADLTPLTPCQKRAIDPFTFTLACSDHAETPKAGGG